MIQATGGARPRARRRAAALWGASAASLGSATTVVAKASFWAVVTAKEPARSCWQSRHSSSWDAGAGAGFTPSRCSPSSAACAWPWHACACGPWPWAACASTTSCWCSSSVCRATQHPKAGARRHTRQQPCARPSRGRKRWHSGTGSALLRLLQIRGDGKIPHYTPKVNHWIWERIPNLPYTGPGEWL